MPRPNLLVARALEGLLLQALLQNWIAIPLLQAQGFGMEVVRLVGGRIGREREELSADRVTQKPFETMIEKCLQMGLDIAFFGEHGIWRPNEADYILIADPIEGSSEFRDGFRKDVWSVAGVLRKTGRAERVRYRGVAGGAVNVFSGELSMGNEHEGMHKFTFGSGAKFAHSIAPSSRTVFDEDTKLSGFVKAMGYFRQWGELMRPWLERERSGEEGEKFARQSLEPYGGSSSYPMLAEGQVEIYAMRQEPRQEPDAGLAIAHIAGLALYEVDPDTFDMQTYEFDPQKYEEGIIQFFVAACTPQLAQDFVRMLRG